jgi:hypothetical protein
MIHHRIDIAGFPGADKQNATRAHNHRTRSRNIAGIKINYKSGGQFDEIEMKAAVTVGRAAPNQRCQHNENGKPGCRQDAGAGPHGGPNLL